MSDCGFELATDGPRVVVVGVDGSQESLRAAAYAMGVARRHNAELIAVRVQPMVTAGAATATAIAPSLLPAVYDNQEQLEKWLLGRLTDDAGIWSAQFRFFVRHGDPAAELTAVVEQSRADLVVVGASTSLAHRLWGSTSQRLSRRRRWVLTIVP